MPELDGLDATRRIRERWPAEAPAHRRDDRERDARGPRRLLRRRDGRLRRQADPPGGAGGGAAPRPPARRDGTARGESPARSMRNDREPERARRRRLRRRPGRHVPQRHARPARRPSDDDDADGGAARSSHAEVERRDVRRDALLGALPRARAQAQSGDLTGAPELAGRIESEYAPSERRSSGAARERAAAARNDPRRRRQPGEPLLLGRGLEQQGHTVEFAEHGREALDLLRAPDLRPDAARRPDARGRRLRGAGAS